MLHCPKHTPICPRILPDTREDESLRSLYHQDLYAGRRLDLVAQVQSPFGLGFGTCASTALSSLATSREDIAPTSTSSYVRFTPGGKLIAGGWANVFGIAIKAFASV